MSSPQRPDFMPLSPVRLALVAIAIPVFSSSFSLLIELLIMQGVGLGVIDDLVGRLALPEGRDAVMDVGVEMTGALFEIMMFAFTVTIARRREARWPPVAVGWREWTKDRSFLPFLGFMFAWQLIEDRLIEPGFPELVALERLPAGTPALLLSLLSTAVLAPVAEEVFFRGFVFSNLRAYAGFATTIVVTSVFSALLHSSDTFVLPLLTLPFGLIAGLARERFASVRPAIYLHMIWNLVAWGDGYFGASS